MKHFLLSLYLSLKAHMTQHIKQIRKKEGNKLKERDKIKRDIKQTNKKRLSLGQNRNGHATRTVTMKGGRRTIFIVMVTTAMRVSATHFVLFFIYLFIIIIIIIILITDQNVGLLDLKSESSVFEVKVFNQSCIFRFGTRFGLAIGMEYFDTGQYQRSVLYIYIYI